MRRLLFLLVFTSACAGTQRGKTDDIDIDVLWEEDTPPSAIASSSAPLDSPALHTTNYVLTWQGKRIGEAKEIFHRSAEGIRVIRHEEIRITRSGVPVDIETEIIIHADLSLHATRVQLRARAGAVVRRGQAIRADNGEWVIALDGEAVRNEPADAVPLELVPYLVAKKGTDVYTSKVLLAGYGFAVTQMQLNHHGNKGKAVLKTQWGDIETQLHMAGDGALLRTATGSTGSIRVDETELKEHFARPELPLSSSIPLRGKGSALLITNTQRQPPPALDGQSISLRKTGWRVHFDAKPAKLDRKIINLTRQVDALLSDSHDAPGAGGGEARRLGRGDCTAHSTLFVDMAQEQGFAAKLVTGYRVNGNALVRHRWALVQQGDTWVQVDPTFGEAPVSPGNHLALAVHGASTAQIALVDEAVFIGLGQAKAQWVRSKLAQSAP